MIPPEVALPVKLLFGAPTAAILFGFFVMRRLKPEWTHWPILASCAAVCASAAWLAAFVHAGHGFDQPLWTWAMVGDWGVAFGVRLDGPSAAVLAMVAFVGSLIHVYAAGYMKGDPGFNRFFLVFHLFFLAMIGLLLSNDYVQLYLFWELVGVASYLLVGFWWHKESARKAALKAFLTNRVGDLGFLVSVVLILLVFKTTRLQLVYMTVAGKQPELLALIAFGLFWAACAKSAQWPLYWWLPDAMEGPTPTSALMHAATMVTAGVFLLVRSWPLIDAVPGMGEAIAWIGAGTALGAAVLAGTKRDLKQVLAYSTVSHLGLMMLALGLGQVGVAVFHLIVHGFFKAVLFLCAGNVAHALHQSTASIDQVGGFRRAMPLTYACFVVAALSLAGVFPFAGFFSKDAILDAAWHHGGALGWLGMAVSAGSAFYVFRLLFLTFHGARAEQTGPAAHPHEADAVMTVPVVFLAAGAAVVGWLGPMVVTTLSSGWTHVPQGVPVMPGDIALPHVNYAVAAMGTAFAALGAGAAWWLTMKDAGWDWRWRREAPWADRLYASDFGWKSLCDAFVRGVVRLGGFVGVVLDKRWWDGLLEGSTAAARVAGDAVERAALGRVNDYLWWMLAGTAILLGRALR
ncbi:MAG: NADH-quinone oxidoreductase subunit L [Elusimicrobiota bacterium]|nr:NADH-quinone oxidoreductase subunit L [Elusimicrobiota bacterium]